MNLVDLLERAAGDPEAGLRFVGQGHEQRWVPWAEVRDRALAAGASLAALGVRPGDRVALLYGTGVDFFEAFFGALCAGAVPTPLYPPVRLGRLEEYLQRTVAMLRAAGARLVLAEGRVRRLLGRAVEGARPELGCLTLRELPDGVRKPRLPEAADALALVQFSSGTTVDPKPVALSHRALIAQAERLNGFWPQPEGRTVDSGVSWLPLYHDMGLVGSVLTALEAPGTLTLIPPELFLARPALWLQTISRYRATISPAPSFAYGLCLEKIADDELEGVDLSCWRVALNGAEPVVPEVMREFSRRFRRWGFRPEALTPVYGLSEAALAVTFSAVESPFTARRFRRDPLAAEGRAVPDREGVELVSVGRPLPGFAVRVVAGDGGILGEGEVGRVTVSGPSLMEGYLGQPEATAKVLRDGWLDTGDLGFLHDGELYVTGRAKDVLILRGENRSPSEVEAAVDPVSGVRTGCSVAVSWLPEGADGERLLLLVEARRGVEPDAYPALAAECAARIRAACGLSPERVEVLTPGTLPRTSSGKLRRQESLRLFLSGELRAPRSPTPLRLVGAMLGSSLAFARLRREGSGAE